MSYPRYTLNFVDTANPAVKQQLEQQNLNSGTPETFDAIARIAVAAVQAGAASVIKGSHTHALSTRNGMAMAFLSHNDEVHDLEPTINIVIF